MDRLDAMKVLVAVVEAGSLSAGARRLGVPLATVSRKVSDLERHLKTRLLIRSSRQMSLTDAGQDYVRACGRILDMVGEAERTASGEYKAPRGNLTITAPISFGRLHVLPIVTAFLKAYPDIALQMIFSDRISHILEDHIDLAIRIGNLADSSFVASRVGEIRRVVCASPTYFSVRGVPRTPSDLRAHDCITFDILESADDWLFSNGNRQDAVAIRSRLIVNTAEAAIDAAVAGLGITRVLSYQVDGALREGRLTLALRDYEPPSWPVSLVHAGQGPLPQKLRVFLDFVAPRLKARLSELKA